jgi:endoglucanase
MNIKPPLSTSGRNIVDANGQTVLLRGINWFGTETTNRVPHGLWQRDYQEMVRQIAELKYNVVRYPFAIATLRASTTDSINFSTANNRLLQGKSPLEVMDIIIQEFQKYNILVLLDCHRLNDQAIPELWYSQEFSESDWLAIWQTLAHRYKSQPNVIGADIKNEPHGAASWGTNDTNTDWRLAAERCGNAIHQIAPHWLVVVEGVERNVPGQKLSNHWWGGNLEGVRNNPVRLKVANKLVYSPHEYGPGVFNQDWFSASDFPRNLINRWETGFGFIFRENIAPILVGEFGGKDADGTSKEAIWQKTFVQYLKDNNLSFTYWCLNPNSDDTGGILNDDWMSIQTTKQNLLSPLLAGVPMPATPRAPVSTPVPSPPPATPTPLPNGTLFVTAEVFNQWDSGLCVKFVLKNKNNKPTKDWTVVLKSNNAMITNSWNVSMKPLGNGLVEIKPAADWARIVQPEQQIDSFGYVASRSGNAGVPSDVKVTVVY